MEPVKDAATRTAKDPVGAMGADWANLSLIEDFSTGHYICEIHLAVHLDSATNAKTIRDLIEAAQKADKTGNPTDPEAKELKKALKKHLDRKRRLNKSTERMVDAILLRS